MFLIYCSVQLGDVPLAQRGAAGVLMLVPRRSRNSRIVALTTVGGCQPLLVAINWWLPAGCRRVLVILLNAQLHSPLYDRAVAKL